jgi:hypothetical protein
LIKKPGVSGLSVEGPGKVVFAGEPAVPRRERRVQDMLCALKDPFRALNVLKGSFRTLNVPKGSFRASAVSRTRLSRQGPSRSA